MARVLGDTNVILRYNRIDDPEHETVLRALARLDARGDRLVVTSQSLAEFWVVATRPKGSLNGFGLSPAEARVELDALLTSFERLPDRDATFGIWRDPVARYGVSGRPAHDARLVAAMLANGVGRILTFNEGDFRRYAEVAVETP